VFKAIFEQAENFKKNRTARMHMNIKSYTMNEETPLPMVAESEK
jgi:hypothetical protein